MKSSLLDRLAVCSWSLQPSSPEQLLGYMRDIGLRQIQIALDPIRENPSVWGNFGELAAKEGFTLASGMFGCAGEDYTSMESIRKTGGIVPDETWTENWENIQTTAELAAKLKLKLVTFHSGFLPHEESDPAFTSLLNRLRLVADIFAAKGIDLGLETGQETAATLQSFLVKLGRINVGVNFDPANMILYDKGNPIESLRTLAPWLKQCHVKDAVKTRVPGTWGDEVVVGTGEVDWKAFFQTLEDVKYSGHCSIEREAGNQRVQDIRSAKSFLETLSW
jgi:sugar phosphate isomerase/epimerase